MVDVFTSGIPCPSTNEDGVKHVIFLKGVNTILHIWLFNSLDLPIIANKGCPHMGVSLHI